MVTGVKHWTHGQREEVVVIGRVLAVVCCLLRQSFAVKLGGWYHDVLDLVIKHSCA